MTELLNGWGVTTLGSICSKPQYGYTTKSSSAGSVRYLRTTDISSGKLNWKTVPFCAIEPDNVNKYQLEDNDIVISRAGSVGVHYLIKRPPENAVFASYLIRFKPKKGIEPRYLSHFFKSKQYWSQITEHSAGVAVQNVNAKKLAALELPLPPYEEQKRIADKLDIVLAKVEAAQAHLNKVSSILKRFRQSVLEAATSGELTKEWRKNNNIEAWMLVSLKDVGSGFNYGSSSKSRKEGKVPVLRMGNLQRGKIDWNDLVYSSDETEIEKYKLDPGDVLFNRTNSPKLVGKTSIYRGEREAIYAGYLIRIKGSEKLNTEYLNIQLNSPHARDYCWNVKTDGVSQSNINAKKLQAYKFELPSLEEQLEIVRTVAEIFSKADYVEKEYSKASLWVKKLTQSILAKAFRGDLFLPLSESLREPVKRVSTALDDIEPHELEYRKESSAKENERESEIDVARASQDTGISDEMTNEASLVLKLLKYSKDNLSAQDILNSFKTNTLETIDNIFVELKQLLERNLVDQIGQGENCKFKAKKR